MQMAKTSSHITLIYRCNLLIRLLAVSKKKEKKIRYKDLASNINNLFLIESIQIQFQLKCVIANEIKEKKKFKVQIQKRIN